MFGAILIVYWSIKLVYTRDMIDNQSAPQGQTFQPASQPFAAQPQQVPVPPAQAPTPQIMPEDMRPQPETLILEWQAPVRPFKKRNRQYYTTIAILVFLVSLILF